MTNNPYDKLTKKQLLETIESLEVDKKFLRERNNSLQEHIKVACDTSNKASRRASDAERRLRIQDAALILAGLIPIDLLEPAIVRDGDGESVEFSTNDKRILEKAKQQLNTEGTKRLLSGNDFTLDMNSCFLPQPTYGTSWTL